MNPPKGNEYDYINFLVATPKSYSCVEGAKVYPLVDSPPAHDALNRLLNYFTATGLEVGVLINFGSDGKLEWKRRVLTRKPSENPAKPQEF